MQWKLLGTAALAVALAGCGTNPGERTTGGAAAGAATGAGIGALGGPVGVGVGALVGAGAGAATGAATTPNQVNLGAPPWRNPSTRVAGQPLDTEANNGGGAEAGSGRVRRLQVRLERAGYNPGPIDGVMGPETRRALAQYRAGRHGGNAGNAPSSTRANTSGNANTSGTSNTSGTGNTSGAGNTSRTGNTSGAAGNAPGTNTSGTAAAPNSGSAQPSR